MSAGYQTLADTFTAGKEELVASTKLLCGQKELARHNAQLQILTGQQDLQRNVERMGHTLLDTLQNHKSDTASKMEKLFREHQMAAQALANATVNESHEFVRLQIQNLVSWKPGSKRQGTYEGHLELVYQRCDVEV
jgi:hypothetical protein